MHFLDTFVEQTSTSKSINVRESIEETQQNLLDSQSDLQRDEVRCAQIKQVYQLVSSSIFYLEDLIDLFRTYTLPRSAYIFVRFHCVQKSNLE